MIYYLFITYIAPIIIVVVLVLNAWWVYAQFYDLYKYWIRSKDATTVVPKKREPPKIEHIIFKDKTIDDIPNILEKHRFSHSVLCFPDAINKGKYVLIIAIYKSSSPYTPIIF